MTLSQTAAAAIDPMRDIVTIEDATAAFTHLQKKAPKPVGFALYQDDAQGNYTLMHCNWGGNFGTAALYQYATEITKHPDIYEGKTHVTVGITPKAVLEMGRIFKPYMPADDTHKNVQDVEKLLASIHDLRGYRLLVVYEDSDDLPEVALEVKRRALGTPAPAPAAPTRQ